jgi:hypothetical protein
MSSLPHRLLSSVVNDATLGDVGGKITLSAVQAITPVLRSEYGAETRDQFIERPEHRIRYSATPPHHLDSSLMSQQANPFMLPDMSRRCSGPPLIERGVIETSDPFFLGGAKGEEGLPPANRTTPSRHAAGSTWRSLQRQGKWQCGGSGCLPWRRIVSYSCGRLTLPSPFSRPHVPPYLILRTNLGQGTSEDVAAGGTAGRVGAINSMEPVTVALPVLENVATLTRRLCASCGAR